MKKNIVALLMVFCLLCTSCALAEDRSLPGSETIHLTALLCVNSNKEGNLVEVALQNNLNVDIDFTYVPATGFDEKLNTTLASGVIPDIIFFAWKSVVPTKWIEQGAVLRLDDPENNLLEDYAPNYSTFMTDDMLPYMTDYQGGIYSVKGFVGFPYNTSLMIRYDWLDKLGLEVPKTMDEFVEVMRAFKTQDPNGNGLADEIPYLANAGIQPFFDAFGITNDLAGSHVLIDGELVCKYDHPNFKACVDMLRLMYEEKLIDAEYITRDRNSYQELVVTDKVGITYDSGSVTTDWTNSLRANGVENALLAQIDPIEGIGGQNIMGRAPINGCAAIASTAADPEACMMVLDYLYSEEGTILTNFGVEGVTFDYVDGEPILKEPYCLSWSEARANGIAMGIWVENWTKDNFLQIVFQGKTLDKLTEVEGLAYHAYTDNADFAYFQLPASLTQTPSNEKFGADVWSPLSDAMNNYIMGIIEWEDFENLLAELKPYALDQITEEINENYQTLLGK